MTLRTSLSDDPDGNRIKCFDPIQANANANCLPLAVNGVHCTITPALSDAFPTEAEEMRAFSTSSSSLPAPISQNDKSTDSLVKALSMVIAPDKQGKKEKANLGASILSLFAIYGTIDCNTKVTTSLSMPEHAAGFNYIFQANLKNQAELSSHSTFVIPYA